MINKYEVKSWLGIPYASAKRFHAPHVLPFDKNKKYDKMGPAPIQCGDASWLKADSFSEDCLNLNIWAPKRNDIEKLPVVVYIFGGGWTMGANCQETSNLRGLAETGRVVGVSINYRLGAFGALSLSQYGGELSEASNLCLKDIIASLKWIRENISLFNGDPNNVTITGHSAGAFNCLSLLAAPEANGLFHHIAAFSGMPSRQVPLWNAQIRAHKVLEYLGITNNPEKIMEIDAMKIQEAMNKTQSSDPGVAHGVDNDVIAIVADYDDPHGVLVDHPMNVLSKGSHRNIDILFSSTTAETDYWVLYKRKEFDPGSIDNLILDFALQNRITISRAKEIVEAFNKGDKLPVEVRGALLTAFSFNLPQTRGALAHSKAGGNAYLLSIGPCEGALAVHGTEMYGIVGGKHPKASEMQIQRDKVVTDAILALAEGRKDLLWTPVKNELYVKGIGEQENNPTNYAKELLSIFDAISRP